MCGRFPQYSVEQADLERYGIIYQKEISFVANYNTVVTQNALALLGDKSGNVRVGVLKWGLIPYWESGSSNAAKCMNARSETVFDKPSFRHAIIKQRCLIPINGYYEWKPNNKTPYLVRHHTIHTLMAAGLWDTWISQEQEKIHTFTILTTEAKGHLKEIHHRMPLLFTEKKETDLWLNRSITDPALIKPLLKPYAVDCFYATEVTKQVNSTRNNFPELLLPEPDEDQFSLF